MSLDDTMRMNTKIVDGFMEEQKNEHTQEFDFTDSEEEKESTI